MSSNFRVTGAEVLLAIAACERTTSFVGRTETKPGQNIAFAYGAVGRLFPIDAQSFGEDTGPANLSVEVQRIQTQPGVYRYQCTIESDIDGVLS